MTWTLARPSFWPEARDPWAWRRALRILASEVPVPDPRPCWEAMLRRQLSRRSVPGLFGLRKHPKPPQVLGLGLLQHTSAGWILSSDAKALLSLTRDDFKIRIAELAIRRSAWLRLCLHELNAGHWTLPSGANPLKTKRQIRIGEDLLLPGDSIENLPAPEILLGDLYAPEIHTLEVKIRVEALSALHSPLYLLHAIGWLSDSGSLRLPDRLAATLRIASQAAILRRISKEAQDAAGFVPIAKVAERLWSLLRGNGRPRELAAWMDTTFGNAIDSGTIEIHAWAPGQPRHGRGLYGDRERKLVRWTIHDDFRFPVLTIGENSEEN